jgi:hypothetical protein
MALELFSRLEHWSICSQNLDVRGWMLTDDAGGPLGQVRDLIVNTESGQVECVVLDNRAEYPLASLDLAGEVLRLRRDVFMTGGGASAAPEHGAALRIRCERV